MDDWQCIMNTTIRLTWPQRFNAALFGRLELGLDVPCYDIAEPGWIARDREITKALLELGNPMRYELEVPGFRRLWGALRHWIRPRGGYVIEGGEPPA